MSTTATPTGTGPAPAEHATRHRNDESDRTIDASIEIRQDRILQYRQLVTSPPGGAVFRSRSTILGAYIW